MSNRLNLLLHNYEIRKDFIKKLILTFWSLFTLGLLFLHPFRIVTNAVEPEFGKPVELCNADGTSGFGTACKQPDNLLIADAGSGGGNPIQVILSITSYMIVIGLVVAIVYFVLAGWKLLTSQGDSKKVEEATKTITYAVLGMIVMALSFFVTSNIIKLLT